MDMMYSEEWARENFFSTAEVARELMRHGAEPTDFWRDLTGSGERPAADRKWSGADVLDWLGI